MNKKNFKTENPALGFISSALVDDVEAEAVEPVEVKTPAPKVKAQKPKAIRVTKTAVNDSGDSKEKKSKRLNLLIQPSVYEDFNKASYMAHTSMNDLVNGMIKEYNKAHQSDIDRFNELFKK